MDKNKELEYWEGHENLKDTDSVRFAVDWFGERLRNPSFDEEATDWKTISLKQQAIKRYESTPIEQRELEIKGFQRKLYKYLCSSITFLPEALLVCNYVPIHGLDLLVSIQTSLVFPPKTYMLVTDRTVKVGSLGDAIGSVEPIFVADKAKVKDID